MSQPERDAYALLVSWDGRHGTDVTGATVYYATLAYLLELIFKDEMGQQNFESFLSTFLVRKSYAHIVDNPYSVWWDNVHTEQQEQRDEIVLEAFARGVRQLSDSYGKDPKQWNWGKQHTITYAHALGQAPLVGDWFNLGPFPISGANEVINNHAFKLSTNSQFSVFSGPAMRRVININRPELTYSVLPTGQSGNPTSPHYDDQVNLYLEGRFREQKMHKPNILETAAHHLILTPANPN